MRRIRRDEDGPSEEGEQKDATDRLPGNRVAPSGAESQQSESSVNIWLILAGLGWFIAVWKGAQLTKKHGLHYPVANYLGVGLGQNPVIPGLAYSILSNKKNSLLVCDDDEFCREVEVNSDHVKKSCFSAAEILDDMDDKGGQTHSRIFYIAYVCPGANYGKWLSYTLRSEPYTKALRVKLFEGKDEASPWRLYKDAEGDKLQCFMEGPGKDHWMGIHMATGDSVLVRHADSIGKETKHSAFTFAMVADSTPSQSYHYALFHEGVKGFLTCANENICRVNKKLASAWNSCWKLSLATDGNDGNQYHIQYGCSESEQKGKYLSTVMKSGTSDVHVGLVDDNTDKWKVQLGEKTGSHISLLTGKYAGYTLGPGSHDHKEFFFIRRINLTPKNEESKEEEKSAATPKEPVVSDSDKYSTDTYKFLGCYQDKFDRDLPKGPRKWGFSPMQCKTACSGFLYFAVQSGSWCSCGNTYGKHGIAAESECLSPKGEMTGGGFRNAVYENLKK